MNFQEQLCCFCFLKKMINFSGWMLGRSLLWGPFWVFQSLLFFKDAIHWIQAFLLFPEYSVGNNWSQKQFGDHYFLLCITRLKFNIKFIVWPMVYQDLILFLRLWKGLVLWGDFLIASMYFEHHVCPGAFIIISFDL